MNGEDTREPGYFERALTPLEIDERTKLHLALATQRDANLEEIADKRKEIRALNVSRKKLDLQQAQIRRELNRGAVLEERQVSLAYDEPAPQLGGWSGLTGEPRHGEGPMLPPVELRYLITCVRPPEYVPTIKQVESWSEQVRADVQRWCRVEHTRNAPIAGLPLPPSYPMPGVLANVVFESEDIARKGKAAKRQATARKATARKAPGKRGRKVTAPRGMRL
jgi:hypothetical protein